MSVAAFYKMLFVFVGAIWKWWVDCGTWLLLLNLFIRTLYYLLGLSLTNLARFHYGSVDPVNTFHEMDYDGKLASQRVRLIWPDTTYKSIFIFLQVKAIL